jgi:spermidine/putrescine transport system substrate-binding protein
MPKRIVLFSLFHSALVAFFVSCFLSGCEKKPPVIKLLIWTDYVKPTLISSFEADYHCDVQIETYSSNDELKRKLKEGRFEADIVVPSSYELGGLIREGYLAPLDDTKLSHRKEVENSLISNAKERAYAVPYLVAPTGLAFTDKLPQDLLNPKIQNQPLTLKWSVLDLIDKADGRRWASKATLLNEKREAIGAALIASGLKADSVSPADLDVAEKTLRRWFDAGMKLNIKTYQYKLMNGNGALAHAYSGDVLPLINSSIRFALPAEGFIVTCDCLSITSTCQNKKLAHSFINFFCDPKNSAQNMLWTLYRAPNPEARNKIRGSLGAPAEILLDENWSVKGVVLPSLSPKDEESLNILWAKFIKFQED